jgi:hypothetical protein
MIKQDRRMTEGFSVAQTADMELLLFLIIPLAVGAAIHWVLFWLLSETSEVDTAMIKKSPGLSYPRTWTLLRRWLAERPPRLNYRRDKNGRFRSTRKSFLECSPKRIIPELTAGSRMGSAEEHPVGSANGIRVYS